MATLESDNKGFMPVAITGEVIDEYQQRWGLSRETTIEGLRVSNDFAIEDELFLAVEADKASYAANGKRAIGRVAVIPELLVDSELLTFPVAA